MYSTQWSLRQRKQRFKGLADKMTRSWRVLGQRGEITGLRYPQICAGFMLVAVCFWAAGCVEEPHEEIQKLTMAAVFATPLEENWTRAIHEATDGLSDELAFEYVSTDDVKQGSFEKILREYAEADYDVVIGDAYFAEEITRRVAREYQQIAFCFASGLGPAKPNFSVFDNWIREPAFVAGMIAGRLTRSNMVGIVGGHPVPVVNRMINAFIEGAQEVNSEVVFRVEFINSWFDPAQAKEAALAMISEGVDVMYAERDGVIEAGDEKEVPVFGNLIDQGNQSEWVVTSVVWDMTPTIRRLVNDVRGGVYTAEDFGEWSWMSKEGSRLSPLTPDWEAKLGSETLNMVQSRTEDIILGKFRVPIIESDPSQR